MNKRSARTKACADRRRSIVEAGELLRLYDGELLQDPGPTHADSQSLPETKGTIATKALSAGH